MALIDNPEAAKRLASAIVTDLTLYNRTKIEAGGDLRVTLADEIAECRALFESRVIPELMPAFESALEPALLASGKNKSALSANSEETTPPFVWVIATLILAVAGYFIWQIVR